MQAMKSALLGAVLLLLALAAGGAVTPPCPAPQSPRNINPRAVPSPYNGRSTHSIVESVSPSQDEVRYWPRGAAGPIETLYRCSQHYHVPVEDVQGCAAETEVITPPGTPPARVPAPGQWIEVHTAYASDKPPVPCPDPESLDCCKGKTVLVLGFSATVAVGGGDQPILTPPSRRLAEWSGSSTGPDKEGPTACKEPAAAWSFRLGCNFKVGEAQLGKHFPGGPQAARAVQGGARVSRDLFLVTPKP